MIRLMKHGRIGAPVLLALLSLSAGCAGLAGKRDADVPKVAILEIEGARSERVRGEIRARVARMVSADDFEVVSQEDYRAAARREGARRKSKRDIVTVSRALDLDAVVHGRLFKKGRSRGRLGLTVRDGRTGEVVDRFAVILHRGEPRGRQREELSTRLFLALDEIAVSHREAEEEEEMARKAEEEQRAAERKEEEEGEGAVAREDEQPAEESEEEPEPLELETDDRGQVVDDEMPDVLDD